MVSNWMLPLFICFASQGCQESEQEFLGRGSNSIGYESGLEKKFLFKANSLVGSL